MKQTILVVAIMAIAGSAFATGPAVGGTAGSVSGSAAIATSSGNGGSFSTASNQTWSSVAYGANSGSSFDITKTGCLPTGIVAQGAASVSGATEAGSISTAGNKSWGNGTGGAVAGGLSNANVAGTAGYANIGVTGGVTGFATSTAGNAVVAGRNEGGFVGSSNKAWFDADAYSKQTNTLSWSGVTQTNVAQTNADAGSVSNAVQFGNATLVNVNGGTAGAGAVAAAGKVTSVD